MPKKFTTLFVTPPLRSMFGDDSGGVGHPHVGTAYLVAMFKEYGLPYKIIDMRLGYDLSCVLDEIERNNLGLIGLTCFSYGHSKVYDVVRGIKRQSHVPVVIGGPHASAIRGKLLEDVPADFAIQDEGEYTMLELVEALSDGAKDLSSIKGLLWRKGEEIIENECRPPIRNLDELPFPAYEEFELEKYLCHTDKYIPILTSRGCPFLCNYCSVRISMGQAFRPRSPENVLSEIEHWYKRGWQTFDVNDDTFTLDMKRTMNICEAIINKGLKIKYNLYNGINAGKVDAPLLEAMRDSGCRFLSYGCEAGNNDVLKTIKKGITVEDVENAVNLTRTAGINHAVNFIVGHPTETYDKAKDSINLAKRLPCNFVNFYNLVPYPGSELFDWIQKDPHAHFLYPVEVYLNELSYREPLPVFETDEFPVQDRIRILQEGFELYEKTAMQFRLGPRLGYLAYVLTRNEFIFKKCREFVFSTNIGSRLFHWLSSASR